MRNLRPIYLIAEGLGFAEATNFAKFFRRETGLTPAAFRAENRG
ncbi:MAG: helix-turn-helix domain-containing protein [Alphaproteobacteria bacterium]